MPTEAIVLAGGFGTRLKSVIKEVPKPMAPINGIPFLAYLLESLLRQGISRTILSVGYLHDVIEDYFGTDYKGMSLVYALEEAPLGTGGGLHNALRFATSNTLFLLNGDTYFNVDLKQLAGVHHQRKSPITFSLKPMQHFDRYGSVELSESQITAFKEKMFLEDGVINGGVYCFERNIFDEAGLSGRFSLEQDYFEKYCAINYFGSVIFDAYFVDIGIPSDYEKAQTELPLELVLK